MTRAGWVGVAVVILALAFALQGGEYSTWDWLKLRSLERATAEEIARLTAEVDSLQREAKAIETDPQVQERIARERFGMIARGEYLYRIVTPDSAEP